ncbi:MAG: GspH/FimT family protein [Bacillota bacterium]|nr:GspH/FimT family protein [Bacillota bacterium]
MKKGVCGGFTLIELVAVLALIAILTAAALPSTGAISRWKLETASRSLAGDLRMVRQEAITSGKVCRIVFFVYTNSYQIRTVGENSMVRLPEGVYFEGSTTFGGVPPYVHFNMFGRPSGGGTVILKTGDGEKSYVIVTPVTGRVRISKDPPDHW